ncbi:uncharacterized protein si:dkey-29h14.10 isoform X2 [Platichthys flesus]|uniref:uncharacterized protein si:dkey-29h14.10 isoform X2 n=1 Tax=Platichthys flesus TaxID=8260 RepID=UPI002DB9F274|nr:uncharacterized protein si:dkey-29h14.10 isoform X2 [Platichthys flesus]
MKQRALQTVMPVKAFNMQRVVQVVQLVQMAAQKSCRRACELFCFQLDTMLCENVNCCPAQNHQQNEDKTTQVALPSPPSTILIVNISNSTLIDCVIGNDTYKTGVAESQPLMQEPDLHMHDQSCSCNHGEQGTEHTSPLPAPLPHCPVSPEEPGINIHSSHLNCVIIGDNNYMHAEQIHRCDALTENTHS